MLLLTSLLLIAAPAPPPPPTKAAPADELQAAIDGALEHDRQAAILALQEALDHYASEPTLALPEGLSPAELEAHVLLTRLHLAKKDKPAAQAAMDRLIRLSQGQTPPVREFGGKITRLYKARKQALEAEGSATITVDCEVACEVVVAQRRVEDGTASLLLGTYDLWILATERDVGWERQELVLDEAGATVVQRYADPAPPEPEVAAPAAPSPPARRSLPRAAEIAGLSAGIGLVIVGAILLSFDNKCSLSGERVSLETTPKSCGDVFETTAGSAALLGVGGGLFVISGMFLTVDEIRAGRATDRRVTLGVSLKF